MSHCSVAPAVSSGLDSQTTFLTLTLFSGRHVGVPRSYTNMAALYWAQWICAKYFDEFLRFRKTQKLKTWTSVTISWLYPLNGFRIFFISLQSFFIVGLVNKFLSASYWIPLSRLTYSAYLLHPLVLGSYFGSFQHTIVYSDKNFVSTV